MIPHEWISSSQFRYCHRRTGWSRIRVYEENMEELKSLATDVSELEDMATIHTETFGEQWDVLSDVLSDILDRWQIRSMHTSSNFKVFDTVDFMCNEY